MNENNKNWLSLYDTYRWYDAIHIKSVGPELSKPIERMTRVVCFVSVHYALQTKSRLLIENWTYADNMGSKHFRSQHQL